MRILVSVIVPVYNVAPYLSRCLDALLDQTLREIEVICVDDGSTDGSAEILEDYAGRDARVRVVRQENAGAGSARNRGIGRASGEFLFFCDPDDSCGRRMLARLYRRACRTGADIVVAGRTLVEAETGRVLARRGIRSAMWRLPQPFPARAAADDIFTFAKSVPWDKFFRRSFVESNGLRFQGTRRSNDVYFVDMALALAERIALAPFADYRYTVDRAGSLQGDKDKYPTAVSDAYAAVEAALRARGLWPCFAKGYAAVYFQAMLYNVTHFRERGNVVACYRRLRKKMADFASEMEIGEACLPNARQRHLYRLLMGNEAPDCVVQAWFEARETDVPPFWIRVRRAVVRGLPFAFRERLRILWARLT